MSNPVLYILMRTDMNSMNPGKGMAQAAHAANMFVHNMEQYDVSVLYDLYMDWKKQVPYSGCGTTIVLNVNEEMLINEVYRASNINQVAANIFTDPTYPITDGETTHLLEIATCGYIFIDKDDEDRYNMLNLKSFVLHP